jgi:hypothetical protein
VVGGAKRRMVVAGAKGRREGERATGREREREGVGHGDGGWPTNGAAAGRRSDGRFGEVRRAWYRLSLGKWDTNRNRLKSSEIPTETYLHIVQVWLIFTSTIPLRCYGLINTVHYMFII